MQLRSQTHTPTLFALQRGVLFAVVVGLILALFHTYIQQMQQAAIQAQPQYTVDHSHHLPVVSLELPHTNKAELETVSSKEWETTGSVFYFEEGGSLGFQSQVEVELHGKNLLTHPQKSFQIGIVDEVGRQSSIRYPLFGTDAPTKHSHFVLRNDEARYARLREQVGVQLAQQATDLDIQQGRPVVVYINGEYWGLYYLRQRFNREYFSDKYGVDEDTIGIVEIPLGQNKPVPAAKGSEADATAFTTLLEDSAACSTCLSYYWSRKRLAGENLIDYVIYELYVANFDWPYNNYKVWRYQTPEINPPESEFVPQLDGKFRWLFFDMDVAFGAGKLDPVAMEKAASGEPYGQVITNTFPLRNLFYDADFVIQYQERVDELLATSLSAETATAIVHEEAAKIRDEMPRQIERWHGYQQDGEPAGVSSMEEWEQHVQMLEYFLTIRPQYFEEHSKEFVEQQLAEIKKK